MNSLIADIGGTNTRCATTGPNGPANTARYRNADFSDLGALLVEYIGSLPVDDRPAAALLAVAAPVRGDEIRMTNLGWSFSAAGLRDRLQLERLRVLNDFEAQAYALPALDPDDLLQLGTGVIEADAPKGVLGPGTGLGVAVLVPAGGDWLALPGEGGHVTLPAANPREASLVEAVRELYGHCSAERLISGPGLTLVHELLHGETGLTAEAIADRMAGGDALAADSFETFCSMLGTVAANLALTVAAFGGIYIAGGILPRHAQRFARSGFRARFEDKGRYGDYLASVPTFLVTASEPALTGLWTRATQG